MIYILITFYYYNIKQVKSREMNSKTKKSQFKNPFDLDPDEEQEEQIPMNKSYKQVEKQNVINPLPFNPYVIEKQQPKSQKNVKANIVETKTFQPQTKQIISTTIKTAKQESQQSEHQLPRRSEPKPEKVYELNQDGDPPLLADIGIDPQMIKNRGIMILRMAKPDDDVIQEPDLSGPIVIALCFGMLLLFSGKIQFGDIYAIFVIGNILLYFLFNFMSQFEIIPLYSIMSTLGYALIPMLLLCFFNIFTSLKGAAGIIFTLAISAWSSLSASNFIEALMKQTQSNRKPLLVYPLFLYFLCFAMIIIF